MKEADILLTTGQRIKKLRNELHFSQNQLSRILSVSATHIGFMEIGKRKVNDRIVKQICDSFNVNKQWLTTGTGAVFSEDKGVKNAKMLALFSSLKPKYQDYIIDAIDRFLKLDEEE